MVVVAVADEQDLDVAEVEAEGFNALLDEGRAGFEVAVDEDVALGRDDEIGGEVLAADVIEVAGDAEGREGLGPGGGLEGLLCGESGGTRRGGQLVRKSLRRFTGSPWNLV